MYQKYFDSSNLTEFFIPQDSRKLRKKAMSKKAVLTTIYYLSIRSKYILKHHLLKNQEKYAKENRKVEKVVEFLLKVLSPYVE